MAGSDLVVSIGANIRQLERQMKAAADVAEKAADDIEKKFRASNPTLGGDFGLGVLKGAIAGIAFDRITRGIIDANKEIANFGESARRAGVEVQRFQELRLAAQAKGVEGKTFDAGINDLAKNLNEARSKENELTGLLDANNIKYKDRNGEVISTNEALAIAADLISRAATEQDKIDIAKRLGIPSEFIPLLEGGAAALERLAKNAAEAGAILDSDVIAKAKQFDDAWTTAWSAFTSNAKASLVQAGVALSELIGQARAFQAGIANAGKAGADAGKLIGQLAQGAVVTTAPAPPGGRPASNLVDAPAPVARPNRGYLGSDATKLPPSEKGGGGGGGGKSEDDQAQARLERYIETLMRQNAVLDAEVATFGKSNAEKRAAVELAKAQVDLSKLDEAERQKVISSLTAEIALSEQKRVQLKNLKDAQDALNEAQKFFGDIAVNALEDLILNGAKAEDVVRSLTKQLAAAALKAVFLGSGPLGGLFGGGSGSDSGVGGIFGLLGKSIFGKATGGSVNPGQAYMVGERGREMFVPTTPGKIIPNNRLVGQGGSPTIQIVQNIAANGDATVAQIARQAALEGITQYDRSLPNRFGNFQKRTG